MFSMKKMLFFLGVLFFFSHCKEEIDCCAFPIDNPIVVVDFKEATAAGCANFYVYKEKSEVGLHLYISGDRDTLSLDLTEKEFSVDANSLKVQMLQFKDEIGNYACDDVANDQGEIIDTWDAIAGQVFIQITEDSISVQPWEMTYKMTVKLKDIQLENVEKELVNLPEEIFEEVYVGWLPG